MLLVSLYISIFSLATRLNTFSWVNRFSWVLHVLLLIAWTLQDFTPGQEPLGRLATCCYLSKYSNGDRARGGYWPRMNILIAKHLSWCVDVSLLYSSRISAVLAFFTESNIDIHMNNISSSPLLSSIEKERRLIESIAWMIIFDDFQIFSNVLQGLKLERERLWTWYCALASSQSRQPVRAQA